LDPAVASCAAATVSNLGHIDLSSEIWVWIKNDQNIKIGYDVDRQSNNQRNAKFAGLLLPWAMGIKC